MNRNKPNSYTQTMTSICNWTNKKKYLIPSRMLKFYVIHGLIVVNFHNIISFQQNKCLENI